MALHIRFVQIATAMLVELFNTPNLLAQSLYVGLCVIHSGYVFSNKVDKMSDIVTGNPLVVKMIVSFNR